MDELFDTRKLFTPSGNQQYTWKEHKAPELKGRLFLKKIGRPTTDQLYQRKTTRGGNNHDKRHVFTHLWALYAGEYPTLREVAE